MSDRLMHCYKCEKDYYVKLGHACSKETKQEVVKEKWFKRFWKKLTKER